MSAAWVVVFLCAFILGPLAGHGGVGGTVVGLSQFSAVTAYLVYARLRPTSPDGCARMGRPGRPLGGGARAAGDPASAAWSEQGHSNRGGGGDPRDVLRRVPGGPQTATLACLVVAAYAGLVVMAVGVCVGIFVGSNGPGQGPSLSEMLCYYGYAESAVAVASALAVVWSALCRSGGEAFRRDCVLGIIAVMPVVGFAH